MKNRINKNYKIETILAALIVSNLINIFMKKLGLPILIVLLLLFFIQNGKGENIELQLDQPNIEKVIRHIPDTAQRQCAALIVW